jgi:heme exporter protein C
MSMFLYLIATIYAIIFWIWRTDVSAIMMRSILPTGAWMTVLTLVTGSLWGKSTWGTYWVWDARLTTELLLLFIYLGLIAIANMIEDEEKTDKALSLMIIFGIFNIPLIYFSVIFWNTLHQGFSLGATSASVSPEIKIALLLCTVSFWLICFSIVLLRAKGLLVARQSSANWPSKIFDDN